MIPLFISLTTRESMFSMISFGTYLYVRSYIITDMTPYIIMERSYMESEPIVAISNETPIIITTAIATYAFLYMRDDLIIIHRYVKTIRITNA